VLPNSAGGLWPPQFQLNGGSIKNKEHGGTSQKILSFKDTECLKIRLIQEEMLKDGPTRN
jgi:hypothetical protein